MSRHRDDWMVLAQSAADPSKPESKNSQDEINTNI